MRDIVQMRNASCDRDTTFPFSFLMPGAHKKAKREHEGDKKVQQRMQTCKKNQQEAYQNNELSHILGIFGHIWVRNMIFLCLGNRVPPPLPHICLEVCDLGRSHPLFLASIAKQSKGGGVVIVGSTMRTTIQRRRRSREAHYSDGAEFAKEN